MLRLPPTPTPLRYRSESSMQRRRSKPHTFEQNIEAEKAKLEAQLANLKPGPEMEAIRKKIRQLDSAPISAIGCARSLRIAEASQRRSTVTKRTFTARSVLRRHDGEKFGHTCFEQSSVALSALTGSVLTSSARTAVVRTRKIATPQRTCFILRLV